jgi:ERCC4-type nuclease
VLFIMSQVRVVIDTRESRLYEVLQTSLPPEALSVEPLEIGDIQIQHDQFRIVVERKTEKDLAASIKDGRYREQKARLLASNVAHHNMYIIENPNLIECHACSQSTYWGALVYTMLRDGIHVIVVRNLHDTAEWITQLYAKCATHPEKVGGASQSNESSYIEHVKIKSRKIENVDRATCYLLQWGQVPGISMKIAQEIAQRYPSWCAFFRAFNECDTDQARIRMLCQIPLVGEKKAAAIVAYLKEEET